MRPLAIAHVTATFPPYQAGTGRVVFHNARVLAARGHRVSVTTSEAPGEAEDPPGVEVRRLRPLLRIGNSALLTGVLALPPCDVIHLHAPLIFTGELTWLRARLRQTPYVVTLHNALSASGLRGAFFRGYERYINGPIVAGAQTVCVVSSDHARTLPLLRGRRVVEVPNGVDVAGFHPGVEAGDVRQRHGIPARAVVVLCVAGLDAAHWFKRVDLLIEAVARCGPEVYLLAVGSGPLQEAHEALARRLSVSERIRFTGAVPQAALPAHYAACDLLALPSIAVESFGLVLLEAMATGKPVITTDLPGPRTVVRDGVDGLVVPAGDVAALSAAVAKLAAAPALRRAMGEAGRQAVLARYTWERSGEVLEGVYRDALGMKP